MTFKINTVGCSSYKEPSPFRIPDFEWYWELTMTHRSELSFVLLQARNIPVGIQMI